MAACAPDGPASGGLEPGPPVIGSLEVVITGVPEGSGAAVSVTGPGGFSRSLNAGSLLTGLIPGTYTVTASAISAGGHGYAPSSEQQFAVVAAGGTATVTLAYGIVTGALTISVTGLPDGVPAGLTLSGPAGFTAALAGPTSLVGLAPGLYSISAADIIVGSAVWVATLPTAPIQVVAGLSPVEAAVGFNRRTVVLTVEVTGLPAGVPGDLTATGPGGAAIPVTGSATLDGLDPGSWTLAALPIQYAGHTWVPAPISQEVTIGEGSAALAVSYAISTGGLTVLVTGLPDGIDAGVMVTGPGGFSAALTGSGGMVGLVPGNYTVAAQPISNGGQIWVPVPGAQLIKVVAGTTPALATVSYQATLGSLTVTVTGLPAGADAAILVTEPGGYSTALVASATITGLVPSSYTLTASAVPFGGDTWVPSPSLQTLPVTAGNAVSTTVEYSTAPPPPPPPPPPPSLNLRVDGLNLTQAAQDYTGAAPLVAGRDGYLRVFALANGSNTVSPDVRVRLYLSGTLVETLTLPAPGAGVPTAVDEGTLTASWNVLVPGALIQPNLTVLADVDPAGLIAEGDEADNQFPVSGTPGAVDVRALPVFNVRFVPVLQQVNGLEGDVSAGNIETFLSETKRMLPVGAYDADLRASYTTTAPALESSNGNGAWGTILSEVLALKAADGSSRYYYGVVKTSYSSGVAGIGYVGGGARTSLGWDRLPSGSGVMAHELGHNMSLRHAPCGGAGGPDPGYPYAGGGIGIWGFDVAALTLKSPATFKDLMGYCSPDWVSDYNWTAMVDYRGAGPNNIVAQGSTGRGLLVWGRITPSGPVLEPAFVVDAPAAIRAPGSERLRGLDAAGRVLFDLSFAAQEVHDLPGGVERAFAFVVPLDRAVEIELATLELQSGGQAASRSADLTGRAPTPTVSRNASGRHVLRWDAARHPMVLLRDGATGRILSFARGGSFTVPSGVGGVNLTWSDGVRSRREDLILR